jgi:copper chaperone CopZ
MFFFGVTDMTSHRAAAVVAQALKTVGHAATVRVDLPMRRVEVESTQLGPFDLHDAIARAGFTALRQWPSQWFHA